MRIGILADSHGRVNALIDGVRALKDRKVDKLAHLGDVTDTHRPETVDDCALALIENDIEGVLGNHEYSFVTHHFKRYPERFSESAMRYLRSLPFAIEPLETPGICLTHFSPEGGVHGLYAATDDSGYKATLLASRWPILINGHSHDPRIYCRRDETMANVDFEANTAVTLRGDAQYILTCGALEDGYSAIFDTDAYSFEIVML